MAIQAAKRYQLCIVNGFMYTSHAYASDGLGMKTLLKIWSMADENVITVLLALVIVKSVIANKIIVMV